MTADYDNSHLFEPVGQILRRLLAKGPLRTKIQAAEVWAVWQAAVGEKVARHAQPVRLEGGMLTVHVDSPAWHHQLRLLEPKILDQLNAQLGGGSVRKIQFRAGFK